MEAQKPTVAKPAAKKEGSNVAGIKNAFLVILACFVVAVLLFVFWFGHESHFEEGHPIDLWGTIYKGGFIVPILQTLFLTVIVLSVERWIALSSAKGKGSIEKFVAGVKKCLVSNDIQGAKALCAKQQGSVAAIVAAALNSYEDMDKNTVLSKEQKIANLQKTVEEATALEMPALQQNLPIVATLTTLGTVIGMIKSFQALAASGAPDSTELSTGISEALINTAFGIATGAFAVISYNFYTNKIDNLTYAIDEIGFSIVQTFAASH
ncbi:MotA/TolQ/ExbB proton channel family protein [uncultured Duncaniella sp.]|uniref:MotA/TolQ/ExbB proton channel family protein n=1 Tax=uncultured Duncaniella sp. TaxID=2768039 RepID=UPI0026F0A99B|nr:MotA/TolQ/ExbB proton channel family protein [uncultured Duncaniella sp.]